LKQNNTIATQIIKKIPLMIGKEPYFYLKLSKDSNLYRLSLNYEYINKVFNIKLKFIRNLNKVLLKKNNIFTIDKSKIYDFKNTVSSIYNIIIDEYDICVFSQPNNKCYVSKYTFINKLDDSDVTTIFIVNRSYNYEENYSILFSSNMYYDIDTFLETVR